MIAEVCAHCGDDADDGCDECGAPLCSGHVYARGSDYAVCADCWARERHDHQAEERAKDDRRGANR